MEKVAEDQSEKNSELSSNQSVSAESGSSGVSGEKQVKIKGQKNSNAKLRSASSKGIVPYVSIQKSKRAGKSQLKHVSSSGIANNHVPNVEKQMSHLTGASQNSGVQGTDAPQVNVEVVINIANSGSPEKAKHIRKFS